MFGEGCVIGGGECVWCVIGVGLGAWWRVCVTGRGMCLVEGV